MDEQKRKFYQLNALSEEYIQTSKESSITTKNSSVKFMDENLHIRLHEMARDGKSHDSALVDSDAILNIRAQAWKPNNRQSSAQDMKPVNCIVIQLPNTNSRKISTFKLVVAV
ncbi:hypothetical protein ACTXT7_011396 [Hymenolepis weldensis]